VNAPWLDWDVCFIETLEQFPVQEQVAELANEDFAVFNLKGLLDLM
jgi:hypothetical protein